MNNYYSGIVTPEVVELHALADSEDVFIDFKQSRALAMNDDDDGLLSVPIVVPEDLQRLDVPGFRIGLDVLRFLHERGARAPEVRLNADTHTIEIRWYDSISNTMEFGVDVS